MKYKLLVLDLDGTLTNAKKEITPRNREALIRVQQQGVKLILASGRPTFGIAPLADELRMKEFGGFILSYNGGEIIDWSTGEIVYANVLPDGIDKAQSLSVLLNKLNMNREEIVAVGDGYNDLSMIQFAGLGVAMGNAQEPVKKAADYITLSNEEDGVAAVVNKFFTKAPEKGETTA